MATKYWLGGGTAQGDFDVAANWSPSGVPADGDTLIYSDKAGIAEGAITGHTDGNHWNCIDDLDQSAKDFPKIIITPEFTGNIGAGYATPLATESALECAAGEISCKGSGIYYLTAKHAAAEFDLVLADLATGSLYVGSAATSGQGVTSLINVRGGVEFLDAISSYLSAPEVLAIENVSSNSTTILHKDNSAASLAITCTQGLLYCDSTFTTVQVSGGTFVAGRSGFVPASSLTLGNITMTGGAVQWRVQSTLNGLIIWAGTVTAYGAEDKTLGLSSVNSGTIEVHGGTLDLISQQIGALVLGGSCEVEISPGGIFMPPVSTVSAWA